MPNLNAPWLVPLLLLSACYDHDHGGDNCGCVDNPTPVSIEIEVYDPVTSFVWEGVSVRILEADQEWSGLTHVNQNPIPLVTNINGRVLFDEFTLAEANVGFREDEFGRALLWPGFDEDEAWVVIEVFAVGFTPVTVSVPLHWEVPDVFVSVPFN